MKNQLIKTSLSLAICTSFMATLAHAASPQNVEYLPSVTLQRVTMIPFADPKSGITFSYPTEWIESKKRDADDIVKIEGQLEGKESGEIKLVHFKSDEAKISPLFAKSVVHQFLFSKLSEFKSLQEKRVAIGSSRRITGELQDIEFNYSGIKARQRYVFFATASGTYYYVFTSPASHFDAMVPLYNNVLMSLQVAAAGVTKSKAAPIARIQASVEQKRMDVAQLPFSFSYPGTWKVEPTGGNRDEVAKVEGTGPKGELAFIVVNKGDVHPDWTLDQIVEGLEKEFFEPQPKFRRLSKQNQDFGSYSKIKGVVEEQTYEMNGAPVKQMVAIFTHTDKAYAVSLVTVGWKDGDTRQLFAKTLAGMKIKD